MTARVRYEPEVRARVAKLSVDHRIPLEQIGYLFWDLLDYELNTKTVERTLEEGYELTALVEAEIREARKQADAAHFDERGMQAAGKLQRMHIASTLEGTDLFVHPKQ